MNISWQNIWTESTNFELIVLAVFVMVFITRLIFIFLFSGRILFIKNRKESGKIIPVSIVITFRNEEENIKKHLPGLLQKSGEKHQVVAVDDFSQDNSFSVLGVLQRDYNNLKVSYINQETRFSEKLAQNLGFKAARNEWLIMVPATIKTYSTEWLNYVAQSITPGVKMVVNYANVERANGFFNRLYRIEQFYQQQKSYGYILSGLMFVYSEKNIGFQKKLYFDGSGYRKVLNEPYANMELLFNQFGRKKHTRINITADTAIRYSEPIDKTGFLELLKKSFRIETYLTFNKRVVLWIDRWTNLLFLPALVSVVFLFTDIWPIIAGAVLVNVLAFLFIIKITQNRLKEPKIFLSSLVYQLVMPYFKEVYRIYFNRKSKKYKWKQKG